MHCFVYKGDNKDDHYLYLDQLYDTDNLPEGFPSAILNLLGQLTLVVDFELTPERKLPQAEAAQVLSDIQSKGFYLQMPKKDMLAEEEMFFN